MNQFIDNITDPLYINMLNVVRHLTLEFEISINGFESRSALSEIKPLFFSLQNE